MKFCKVVKVETRWGLTGNEMWDVTLACGTTRSVMRRKRNSRTEKKAPARLKCDCKEKP